LKVKGGLNRYQKFPEPIFTPTTKAEVGHDENMTMDDIEKLHGQKLAQDARDAALRLFARGQEIFAKRGFVLIDTKYEFGVDEQGKLHVIDEVNTPDSSRLCDIAEWEAKYPKVEECMATGKYRTVTDLLNEKPELKMKEFSKQFVRDGLLAMGFKPETATEAPKMSEEIVLETACRYITIFERITGQSFVFPEMKIAPEKRILMNLQKAGLIKGGCAMLMAESDSTMPHLEALKQELDKFNVPSFTNICPSSSLKATFDMYNRSIEPMLIINCGSGAISGTASNLSRHPVISCLPAGTSDPSGSSLVLKTEDVGKFAAQVFSQTCPDIKSALQTRIQEFAGA